MISLCAALDIVRTAAAPLPGESVKLSEALGRVLCDDVEADMDFPPFDKSCMDGFAARRADLGQPLEVLECIAAGQLPTQAVGPGQCSRIMTGAMLPAGADVVFMVEHSEVDLEGRARFAGERTADNIARRGEDLRRGQIVLRAGTLLRPRHIAALAAVGCAMPRVVRRPIVGVIATGDELVMAHETPAPGQIRNSNSPQIVAQAQEAGCEAWHLGNVSDDLQATRRAVDAALEQCDVLLLSGGVSMGDFDHVPRALEQCGVRILFDRVAVKPGKPATFGVLGDKAVFGLPGNPVSTFVIFELLARPYLMARMGQPHWRPVTLRAELASPIRTKNADREQWLPVALDLEGRAHPVRFHGSGHFASLVEMSGLVCLPIGLPARDAGEVVDVRLV